METKKLSNISIGVVKEGDIVEIVGGLKGICMRENDNNEDYQHLSKSAFEGAKANIIADLLINRRIVKVNHHRYLDWGMCISSIELDDNSVIEFAGNADEARIESITLPDGKVYQL